MRKVWLLKSIKDLKQINVFKIAYLNFSLSVLPPVLCSPN